MTAPLDLARARDRGEMRGEQGDALATIAYSIVEILEEIEATRTKIWHLALKQREAPKPTVKDRRAVLHIVDSPPEPVPG
jgi:hypothetical protein